MKAIHRFSLYITAVLCLAIPGNPVSSQPLIDLKLLILKSDLLYYKPVARSEEGMPVGNGRMGSLVWTTPSSLKFQINRNSESGKTG